MQPQSEGYGDDFTAKCGHCNRIQANAIHAHSGNLSAMFKNQNMTAAVVMEMKYLHVGISN